MLSYLPSIVLYLIMVPPAYMIVGKAGLSRWWLMLLLVPLGCIPFAWIVALKRWQPAADQYSRIFGDAS